MIQTVAACVAMAALIGAAGFLAGMQEGADRCTAQQAQATGKAQAQANVQTKSAIARGTGAGQQRERARTAIDARFNQLAAEAAHELPDAVVDACVLPADRLRRWAAANAGGADQGAAPGEPDGAAADAAASGFGIDARPGGEPPRGGTPVPPDGGAALQLAGLPGTE